MDTQLSKGTILQNGKYQIEKVLGQGGFGITYLARQESLKRDVCIKEFFMRDFNNRSETNLSVTLGTSANKELIERYLNKFIKEAQTIAALEHPNIIHIHDIFKENDTAYYVMDYIEGESLAEMVKHRGPLPEEEAVAYIRSVADALKYVHERSINHLDVKPGNIMVRRSDSRVFLLDFGLSKQYDTAGNQTSSTPLGISHGFAPIEQYSPEGIKAFSPQTDIYSLGATLYYLITGATPPPASELFASELEGFPSTVSASVKEAVGQAMKPQKKERPQSVDDFLKLLPQSGQTASSGQIAFQESVKTEQAISAAEETSLLQDAKTTDQQDMVKDESQNTSNQQLYDFEVEDPRRKRTKIIAWSVGIVALVFICFQGFKCFNFFSMSPEELYQEGKQACENKNYAAAFPLLERAAEKGHAEAQNELGELYLRGKGVTSDATKALEWFRKAAEQGIAEAKNGIKSAQFSLDQRILTDYVELKIGDYFYSDGTFSHALTSKKQCVGIVFSLETTKEEKERGWTHGYIIALSDAQDGACFSWGPVDIDLPSPHTTYYGYEFAGARDFDGYLYSNSKYTKNSAYGAFEAARNYPVLLPDGKTSGWYLPSIGQWKECLENLYKLTWGDWIGIEQKLLADQIGGLSLSNDTYWSSTESGSSNAWGIIFGYSVSCGDCIKNSRRRVRPIAAF